MRLQRSTLLACILSAALTACSNSDNNQAFRNGVIGIDSENWQFSDYSCPQHSLNWNDVNDWYYQLQFMDYFDLSRSEYDLIVMDSEPRTGLNRNIVDRIRCDGTGEKLVLAYLPIGKAENFRNYWQPEWTLDNPSWIAGPNADWAGEFIVRYWDPEWKNIIMGSPDSRLDIAIAAGFDGVVLDGVDVYKSVLAENANAVADLQTFVTEIREYAISESGNPDFGLFVQNTEELINDSSIDWSGNLTGLIKLSHYFAPMDTPVDSTQSDLYAQHLQPWTAAGKLVLSVDFATESQNISQAYAQALQNGYVPLTVNSVELDNLTIPSGYEPD